MARHGSVAFVLHGHLPYVLGHGHWPHGEEWLWEAAAECYLPLCDVMEEAARAGQPAFALGVTPVLAEMLADERFREGLPRFLEARERAADEDAGELQGPQRDLAREWVREHRHRRDQFEVMNGDLPAFLRAHRDAGSVEILGGPATHPYGPLLSPSALRFQYDTGLRVHERLLGRRPAGVWMPECAYQPGHETLLQEQGVLFTIAATALRGAEPGTGSPRATAGGITAPVGSPRHDRPKRLEGKGTVAREDSTYRTHRLGLMNVSVLLRDPFTSELVWSGHRGYPGAASYREFHKRRQPGGHRYWRVTDPRADLGDKQPYDPAAAEAQVRLQARHFIRVLERIVARHPDEEPLIVAPYDAELFGHWWYEGPRWLAAVLRLLREHPTLRATTPSRYLQRHPPTHRASLVEGSWGEGGDHRTWSGLHADPVWRQVHEAQATLSASVPRCATSPEGRRVLAQMARSVLLLQASDWPFLLYRDTAADYAAHRTEGHAADVRELAAIGRRCAARGNLADADRIVLEELESRDRVFRDLDPVLMAAAGEM